MNHVQRQSSFERVLRVLYAGEKEVKEEETEQKLERDT
jgi:hypothetical protein